MANGAMDWPAWIEAAGVAFTAAFTAVLAIATIKLWNSTNRLAAEADESAKSAKLQTKLTREMFFAANPPRITLRNVSTLVEGGKRKILYTLVNTGGTTAKVIESWIMAEWASPGTAIRNMLSTGHNDLGLVTLERGQVLDCQYIVPEGEWFWPSVEVGKEVLGEYYFAGTVKYEDPTGYPRRCVFRRRYDVTKAGFYRTDDPDHEYSD